MFSYSELWLPKVQIIPIFGSNQPKKFAMSDSIQILCENLGGPLSVPMGTPLHEVAARLLVEIGDLL